MRNRFAHTWILVKTQVVICTHKGTGHGYQKVPLYIVLVFNWSAKQFKEHC